MGKVPQVFSSRSFPKISPPRVTARLPFIFHRPQNPLRNHLLFRTAQLPFIFHQPQALLRKHLLLRASSIQIMSSTEASSSSSMEPFFVRFYDESISARDSRGRTLYDILRFNNEELEYYHDYIQILFPLPEGSPFNASAPIIDRATFQAFRSRKDLRDKFYLSFKRMVKFYGSAIASNGNVTLGSNWDQASRNWVKRFDHNHLRITRIIRSLRVLGLEDEAESFFQSLVKIYNDSGKISHRSLTYWTRAAERPLYLAPEDEEDKGQGVDFLYEFEQDRQKDRSGLNVGEETEWEGIKDEGEQVVKSQGTTLPLR